MKKAIVFALLAWSNLHIAAQITVLSSTFPAVGDQLRYVQAANPNAALALYTPPGGNQYWDLSALIPAFAFDINYRPASEGAIVPISQQPQWSFLMEQQRIITNPPPQNLNYWVMPTIPLGGCR